LLRTVICFGTGILGMLLLTPFGVLGALLHFTPLRRASDAFMYKLAQVWSRTIIFLTGTKLTVSGLENRLKTGPVCFMPNHSGLFDILLLLAFAGRPFGFIAKQELSFIPFLNAWILVLGGLFIDRKNPRKGIKTINEGVRRIKEGGAMLIFPEGTRSKGRGLLPFKSGSFKLPLESGAAIIPVAISGSYDLVEKNKKVIPCPTSIYFAQPLAAASSSKLELSKKVRESINGILQL